MQKSGKLTIEERVVRAAEEVLREQKCVSAIDLLVAIRLLEAIHVKAWRSGRIQCLGGMIQGNPEKIARALSLFREWANAKGLLPSEIEYIRRTPNGTVRLQVSDTGHPVVEKLFSTHYVSPEMSERERKKLHDRLSQPPATVVYQILRDSKCTRCGAELPSKSFLTMDAQETLCLPCAGLSDHAFLSAGDALLTRRATRYSGRSAVVVRFSRARKRYERQGVLVESEALDRAEQECR